MTTSDKIAIVNIAATIIIAAVTLVINWKLAERPERQIKRKMTHRRKKKTAGKKRPKALSLYYPSKSLTASTQVKLVLWAITLVSFVEAIYNAYVVAVARQWNSTTTLLNLATCGVAAVVCIGSLVLHAQLRR